MAHPRVFAVAPMPAEKSAYALARYSRSPDSIRDSVEWVRTHDSQKFLESFYFQYGHASIADLGHTVLCFEGISELGDPLEAQDGVPEIGNGRVAVLEVKTLQELLRVVCAHPLDRIANGVGRPAVAS